jgi:hypothetical protein
MLSKYYFIQTLKFASLQIDIPVYLSAICIRELLNLGWIDRNSRHKCYGRFSPFFLYKRLFVGGIMLHLSQ